VQSTERKCRNLVTLHQEVEAALEEEHGNLEKAMQQLRNTKLDPDQVVVVEEEVLKEGRF
jgi:hypothetical protein